MKNEILVPEAQLVRIPYTVISISLAKARDNEGIVLPISADRITVLSLSTTKQVFVRLNYNDAALIPILGVGQKLQTYSGKGRPLYIKKLYLTHDADPTGSLSLALGGEAGLEIAPGQTVIVQNFDTQLSYVKDIRDAVVSEIYAITSGNAMSVALAQTTSPLAAGASWYSPWFSVARYGRIIGTVVTDQNGNFYVQQSNDGSNVDADESSTYTAGTARGFWTEVVAPYARFVFNNTSGSDQTAIRITVRGRPV